MDAVSYHDPGPSAFSTDLYETAALSKKQLEDLKKAIQASIVSAENDERQFKPAEDHRLRSEPTTRLRGTHAVHMDGWDIYHGRSTFTSDEYNERRHCEQLSMHFLEVELSGGDTLVFIDYPEGRVGRRIVDCDGLTYRSQKFRVHSEKLIATGSSKFADMLGPTYQFRIQRRRNLVKNLPDGIKYVLDLTPPTEGDDMVFQMTELSLTPGIIKWWSAYARLDVPFFLVKGHDDVCQCKSLTAKLNTASTEATPEVSLPLRVAELELLRDRGQALQVSDVPAYFQIPDYCPIRHRNGIVRLLMLIEGKQVFLDSAARAWTLVALAKIWDCAKTVKDDVLQWLLQSNNSKFIEVLPEEALKIGGILESYQITRMAFQILVNELALEVTSTDEVKCVVDFSNVTIFGRRKGDPGDDFSNLIQHAARAYVERLTKRMDQLQYPRLFGDLFDDWDLPQWHRLCMIQDALERENHTNCETALNLIDSFKRKVRAPLERPIIDIFGKGTKLCGVSMDHIDADRALYVEPPDFRFLTKAVYKRMAPIQRLLTRFPYQQIDNCWSKRFHPNHADTSRLETVEFEQKLEEELTHLYRDHEPRHQAAWQAAFNTSAQTWLDSISDFQLPLDMKLMRREIHGAIEAMKNTSADTNMDIQPLITRHLLLSLNNDEFKYLPLWAGGCNDGTGGVFEDHVPETDMGPNGPGPAYHTGMTIPSTASSLPDSFVDDMSAMNMADRTTAGSVDVHDSVSTIYQSDMVISDDESIASEAFNSDMGEYHEAQYVVDAAGNPTANEKIPETLDEFLGTADAKQEDSEDSTSTIGYHDSFDHWLHDD